MRRLLYVIRHLMRRSLVYLCSVVLVAALAACDRADKALEGRPALTIWPGLAPGSENWDVEELAGFRSITDVSTPTLTLFEPAPAIANGNAMIVCPGGGFTGLSVIKEGVSIAKWLSARGVTAFVLKYRVRRDEPDGGATSESDDFDVRLRSLDARRKMAAADGMQAMRYLRAHASELKINPDRIGMIGFSAGAMTTMSVVTEGAREVRPNIAASIYGAMPEGLPPIDAPPVFLVHAEDDPVVPVDRSLDIQSAWSEAGLPVELHLYESGGHGFGAEKNDTASDAWMDTFEKWLIKMDWMTSAAAGNR